MTLREINEHLRNEEINSGANPLDRLVAFLSIMRSAVQREIATNEGVYESVCVFRQRFGKVTTETVDQFTKFSDTVLDFDIPDHSVFEILDAI